MLKYVAKELINMMEIALRKRLEVTKERLKEIDDFLMRPDAANDLNKFKELNVERAQLEPVVEKYNEFLQAESDQADAQIMSNDDDVQIAEFGKEESKRLIEVQEKIIDELKILLIPKDPNDEKNIVVEIRGAVGGDEANIFAGDLFRMYARYAENNNWQIQMIDTNPCEAGGFSLVSFMVRGKSVYSKLKFESGAHRVQRVPKTEAGGRIHTSTATVLVMPEAEEIDVEIKPDDLQIDTFRSQGSGGQNVNKVESAVRITHLPTGISVACQVEKSQIQNRNLAMNLLRSRIYAAKVEEQEEKIGRERKLKVGTGERSEKIRTYNYPQNRVTDHRINFTLQKLDRIIEGDLDEIISALINYDQKQKMENEETYSNN
jgi:peptide chain release factor 1